MPDQIKKQLSRSLGRHGPITRQDRTKVTDNAGSQYLLSRSMRFSEAGSLSQVGPPKDQYQAPSCNISMNDLDGGSKSTLTMFAVSLNWVLRGTHQQGESPYRDMNRLEDQATRTV